jgi:hypothetical protein
MNKKRIVVRAVLNTVQQEQCGSSAIQTASKDCEKESLMLTKRLVLLLLMAAGLMTGAVACGGALSASPAQQLLGRWEADLGMGLEFFSNGVFIQTNPSGNRFAGTYTLSEDGKTLVGETNGSSSRTTVVIDGDKATLFGVDFRRAAAAVDEKRPAKELIVGTWSGQGGTYDFHSDGSWAYYLSSPEPTRGGRYTISEDGKAITLSSEAGKEERGLSLVTASALVLDPPFVFDRTADTPAQPVPTQLLAEPYVPVELADIAVGQVVEVGPYSLVAHGAQRLTLPGNYSAPAGEVLGVEFSVRNDGTQRTGGPVSWRYAMLSASGERLNEEGQIRADLAEEFKDQLPEGCSESFRASAMVPVATIDLPPGAALRTWVFFQITPGLEADDLQLEIQVNEANPGPGISFGERKQLGQVRFRFDGGRDDTALPWQPADGQAGPTHIIRDIQYSDPAIGDTSIAQEGDPCSAERAVSLRAANQQAKTAGVGFAQGTVFILDAAGRLYNPSSTLINRSMSGEYALGPKEEKQISVPFPAAFGTRDTAVALVVFDDQTWYQFPLE